MWTDTEKADNHLYNKFIRKQKYQFQARLLDRIDHDDIAGKRALLRLLNIQITEQRLQEEVTMSAPNYLIDSLSQTAETCFYKPDCYQYLIHPVTSISGHLSEIHQTIKAAKHDRHYVIKDDDQSNDNGVRIPEAEYVSRKRKVLRSFVDDLKLSDKPLTEKQTAVILRIGESLVQCSAEWKYRGCRRMSNDEVFMILGLPGVGKTTITISISLLAQILGAGVMVSCAWSGVAAALVDGVMLLRTFKIGGAKAELPLCATHLYTLEQTIKKKELAVFHIDECSQLHIQWIWYLHIRLCQVTGYDDCLFGGVIIIFSGDFAQNGAIGGDQVYNAMMRFASGAPSKMKSTIELDACRLLAKFKTIVLDVIVRSEKDPEHSAFVAKLARGGSPTMEEIKSIQPYSVQDVTDDPSWINATWVVTTNQERLHVGYQRAICWAKFHKLPLIRWRRIPTNKEDVALLLSDTDDEDPCLWELFVPGVVGYLKTIMNVDMKLTNGTFIIYDSLTFKDTATAENVRTRLEQTAPGDFVTLEEPPAGLHVRPIDEESIRRLGIVQENCNLGDWNCREGQPDGVFGPRINRTNVVVPLLPGDSCEPKKFHIKGRRSGAVLEIILQPSFAVEMALCMTADKMQGCTLPKVVLTLAQRVDFLCRLNHCRLLVAISRVRSGKDLRAIFPRDHATGKIDYEECEYLTRLKPDQNLIAMLAGFCADPENMDMMQWDAAAAQEKLFELKHRHRKSSTSKARFSCV
jgi:hypothetical protein